MDDKVVLGILTAHHPSRWHRRQIALCQFLKDCPIPYKFVFGDAPYPGDWNRTGIPDEDILYAPGSDSKDFMPLKNLAFFKWALDQGATHALRICDDTWVYVDRVLKAGLAAFDLAGHFPCKFKLGGTLSLPFLRMNYPHGGCGVWLSRKSMEMLVESGWNENYLDSWPDPIDVGFGVKYPKPPKFWDDHWLGEVLQGNLSYDDPRRNQPWEAYTQNGIALLEDAMLFENSEPQRPLCIHDPGVHKPNDHTMDELMEQIRKRNVTAALVGRAAMPVRVESGPPAVESESESESEPEIEVQEDTTHV
jgi:hypothetical protein